MESFFESKDLMEQLISYLDLPSLLALASVHQLTLEVLQQRSMWRDLVRGSKLVKPKFWHCGNNVEIKAMLGRVDMLTTLLKLIDDPGPLLQILLETICSNFPPSRDENGHKDEISIQFSSLCSPRRFSISPTGFLLLERAERQMKSQMQIVTEVQLHYLWDSLAVPLSSRARRQGAPVKVLRCEVAEFTDEEEAVQWISFLQRCSKWSVESFCLYELGKLGWTQLARALGGGRGSLGSMSASREVVAVARMEEVRQVWEATRLENKVLLHTESLMSFAGASGLSTAPGRMGRGSWKERKGGLKS